MINKGIFSKYIAFLLIFTLIIPSISSININNNEEYNIIKNDTKEWTMLYYIDADFGLFNADFLEFKLKYEVASTENINVVVLQDLRREPAFLYYIDEHHNKVLLDEMGEINMGDPQTLIDFIKYGKENYPANRYQLCPYGHASGWYGICPDETNNGDYITADEFKKVLRETGGVDLLSFIGCCLTGSLELVYELKDYCEVFIASESSGNENDWVGMFDHMCSFMNNNTDISTISCGEKIVEFICSNENEFYDTMTISAIRTDKIKNLVDIIDKLSCYLIDADELYDNFKLARNLTKDFDFVQSSYLIDLYDFVENYIQIETDSTVLNLLNDIKSNISEVIIAECHGRNQTGSNGISIFYSEKDMISTYSDYKLDFTLHTHWDELLNEHKENKNINNIIDIINVILKKIFISLYYQYNWIVNI